LRNVLVAISVFAVFPLLLAQQTLNNDSVIKMVKMGFPEDMIVNAINRSPGSYDTSVKGIVALQNAGVGTKALSAMVLKDTTPARSSSCEVHGPAAASVDAACSHGPSQSLNSSYNRNLQFRHRLYIRIYGLRLCMDSLMWLIGPEAGSVRSLGRGRHGGSATGGQAATESITSWLWCSPAVSQSNEQNNDQSDPCTNPRTKPNSVETP